MSQNACLISSRHDRYNCSYDSPLGKKSYLLDVNAVKAGFYAHEHVNSVETLSRGVCQPASGNNTKPDTHQ